ncbi:MFS transporter [Neisseriaceae bacterium TC5R-5]|nr:MFS transporter [Neisseriaceae bacterium TC5R-5]
MNQRVAMPSRTRQVVAATIGNALEWYDFIVYGFMTGVIAKLFFPAHGDGYVSLLLTTATFGAGFVMRPIGGVLLGLYADRKGRKAALQLIMGLMTLAVLMITLAPPYAVIGVAAPAIMLLARLLQGFSSGGEFASSTAFLVESAPPGRRGFYGSWQFFGQYAAVLGGSVMGALVTYSFTVEQLESWAWRLPFAIGLLIGPVGMWVRRYMHETDEFVAVKQGQPKQGMGQDLRAHWRGMLLTAALIVPGTALFYVVLVNMPGYASRQFSLPLEQTFSVQIAAVSLLTVITPLSGWLSDYVSRRSIVLYSLGSLLLLVYPLFWWLSSAPSIERFLVVQLILCALQGMAAGPLPAIFAEQFSTRVRSTAMSISYNLGVMLFGGFAPLIVLWLSQTTASSLAPAFYLMLCVGLGVIACWCLREESTPVRSRAPSRLVLEKGE